MMYAFVLTIAIITNTGDIDMRSMSVGSCPEQAALAETMNKLQTEGNFIKWNATCVRVDPEVREG